MKMTTEDPFLSFLMPRTSDPLAEAPEMGVNSTESERPLHSEIDRFSRSLLTFTAVMITSYLIIGVFGNSLTITAILRNPRVRNVTSTFIISLSAADLLFCILVLPFEISRFAHGTWIHGAGPVCILFPFLRYWNIGCSLLSIAMITVNRYVMIAHHGAYSRIYQMRNVLLMIGFVWVFSFAILIPTLAGKWGKFAVDPRLQTCTIVRVNKKSSKQALFVIGFIIPCIAIIVCYSRIFCVLKQSESRIKKHIVSESDAQRTERERKNRKNDWRLTKMILVVFVSFVICYLPITVSKLVDPFVKYPGLHMLGYILVYLSACINPVIYAVMNRQYRQAFKTVLLCRAPRGRGASSTSGSRKSKERRFTNSKTMISQMSVTEASSSSPAAELPEVFPDPNHDKDKA